MLIDTELFNDVFSSDDGWQTITGTFKGAGDESSNKFRVSIATVRPVILFNYQETPQTGVATQISDIQLVVNPENDKKP